MYAAQHVKPRPQTLLSRHPGTHAAPGPARKAALCTVPAAAIAGTVLIAAPAMASTHYTVRPGDTLSAIAQQYYGNAGEWEAIAQANLTEVPDANRIYPGEDLLVPGRSTAASTHGGPAATVQRAVVATAASTLTGQLGCSGLERLWEDAGGPSWAADTAASVAMAESGGNQYALSPTNDYGYWQINGSHGPALATYNALGNAKAAVEISSNGGNWTPWTTYTSGAYYGRC
jgi:LysM repeat protein